MVINAAPRFQSPLVPGRVTEHKNPASLVAHCMSEMRAVTTRGGVEDKASTPGAPSSSSTTTSIPS